VGRGPGVDACRDAGAELAADEAVDLVGPVRVGAPHKVAGPDAERPEHTLEQHIAKVPAVQKRKTFGEPVGP